MPSAVPAPLPRGKAPRRPRSPLALLLLLLLGALGWWGWRAYQNSRQAHLTLLVTPGLVEGILETGEVVPLYKGDRVSPGTVLATRQVEPVALGFAGATLRLASRTKLRVVRVQPLLSWGGREWPPRARLELSLERGRLWIHRDAGTAVTVLTPGHRVEPAPGHTELNVEPGHDSRVVGWTAESLVMARNGGKRRRVEAGQLARFSEGNDEWERAPRESTPVDSWVAWNVNTPIRAVLSGRALPRLPRLSPPPYRSGPRAEPTPFRWPLLPPPDYPLATPRRKLPRPPSPPPSPSPELTPPEPVAAAAPGGPFAHYEIPPGLSTSGRDELPAEAVDLHAITDPVRTRERAERLMKDVAVWLRRRFRMELSRPLELELATEPSRPGGEPELRKTPRGYQARLPAGFSPERFAAACCSLLAQAWLQEQPGRVEDPELERGFARWMAYKYSHAAGNRSEARSLALESLERGIDPGFATLWDLEAESGERGVFEKVLGR